jgi:thermitase
MAGGCHVRLIPPAVLLVILILGAVLAAGIEAQPSQRVVPNDPLFKYQLSFLNPGGLLRLPFNSYQTRVDELPAVSGVDLDITRAWTITTGSKRTVVAVLDDGFFYQHEDIRDNLWHNPGESGLDANGLPKETNGIDDDGNGYVDDVIGWDFAFDDPDPDCYVFEGMRRDRIQPYTHSMPTLGIIGAKGNNGVGIAGINWDVSMMLLKIGAQGTPRGEVDLERKRRAARAIRYATDNGARIIEWSGWVGDKDIRDLADLEAAFAYAARKGVLIVMAAGNGGRDHDAAGDPAYPQDFKSDNLVLVAEVTLDGKLDQFSGRDRVSSSDYGRTTVRLAAIGRNFSTGVRNGQSVYAMGGGTSHAAPVVAGVAALIYSIRPDLTDQDVKQILIQSATRLPALEGKLVSGGMVNAYAALKMASGWPSRVFSRGGWGILPPQLRHRPD